MHKSERVLYVVALFILFGESSLRCLMNFGASFIIFGESSLPT